MGELWAGTATVLGKPASMGSKRAFMHPHTKRVVLVDQNAEELRNWQQSMRQALLKVAPPEPLPGPFAALVTIYLARPQGHYGTGRNAGQLKASAPVLPTKKCIDSDKGLRAALDCGTGIVWQDDSQVVDARVRKFYADAAHPASVTLSAMQLQEQR